MATETELKLGIDPESVDTLLRHPILQSKPKQQHLYNTYFDTNDLALTRQKVAVRERRTDQQTLLTIKTAGQSRNGLSQRLEWEGPTTPGAFDFKALVDDVALAESLSRNASQLVPIFSTDFERLAWRVTVEDSLVEVALDRGSIRVRRRGRQATMPICELELELKSGDPAALSLLANQLQTQVALKPLDESKAARGYALFHDLAA